VLYGELVRFYERLDATTKRLEMTAILVDLLEECEPAELPSVLYLTQGKIAPDYEGVELGLADKLVVRALVEITGLPESFVADQQRSLGDIGDLAAALLRRAREGKPKKGPGSRKGPVAVRQATLFEAGASADDDSQGSGSDAGASLTVRAVHDAFLAIARAAGSGSQEQKTTLLRQLLFRADESSARYLVRTVTGRLRLGVADMTLVEALAVHHVTGARFAGPPSGDMAPAPARVAISDERLREIRASAPYRDAHAVIEAAYNRLSDLGSVAEVLAQGGVEAARSVPVRVGIPLRPMLAERVKEASEILPKLGDEATVEWKYDGLRLQAHISETGPVRLFSRRLENVTDQFPDVAANLREGFQGRSCIVEGEAVPTHADTGEIRPFQEIASRRGRKHGLEAAIEEVPVTMFLFDCLLLDARDLTAAPLPNRRAALERAFRISDRVRFSTSARVRTTAEIESFFQTAIDEGAEGIMAKSVGPESTYRAGSRGWQWVKFKREYRSELSDTLDLVVVGAFAGRGRRTGWYGALLVAAYNPADDVFETVCKLGTGFDDPLLASMPQMFRDRLRAEPHPRVRSRLIADFWFDPALVAEVRGAELTLSQRTPRHRDEFDRVTVSPFDFLGSRERGGATRGRRMRQRWMNSWRCTANSVPCRPMLPIPEPTTTKRRAATPAGAKVEEGSDRLPRRRQTGARHSAPDRTIQSALGSEGRQGTLHLRMGFLRCQGGGTSGERRRDSRAFPRR
jgi:DNA ligase-1